MGEHAFLSASSSNRWISCSPSARLEENFENKDSIFAAEGTDAHALAEYKLKKYLGIKSQKPKSEFDEKELEYYELKESNEVPSDWIRENNIQHPCGTLGFGCIISKRFQIYLSWEAICRHK